MRERRAFYVVFAIAAALVVPATIALRTVIHPGILQTTSNNPTPLGYTWSLALFIIPIGALAWWFACRPDLQFPRKAFWRTIAVLTPLGFLLDLLFGTRFSFSQTNWPLSAGEYPRLVERFPSKNSFSTSQGSCWCCLVTFGAMNTGWRRT